MKQGWEIKKLSDIGKVFNGNSINEKVKKDNYTNLDNGYPFIATKDVGFDSEIDYENGVKIPFSEKTQFKIAPANTPLICAEGGSAGRKIGFTNQDVCFGNKLFALVSNKNVDSKFIFYYYFNSSFQKHFTTEMTGIIGGVSMNKFKDIEIPIPPLPEQQRIVAILDEAFATISKAKANAQKNLQNAKELFESYLQGVFENKGEGWEEKTLGEIGKVIGGYSFKSTDFEKEGKYQVLRMGNVRPGIIRENENPVFINKLDESVLKRALLLPNDVIITQTGTKNKRDYGFTVIIENENYLLNQRISAIRFSKNYLPKFFLYYSWTNLFKDQYFANETGTVGQGNVGIGAITEAIIPVVSLKTQQTIVQKLDALNAKTKKLEAIYQQKINDLEELKKSVLQKAFSGELSSPKGAEYINDGSSPSKKREAV